MKLLQSGKVKSVYAGSDGTVTIEFRDDITAGNGAKHDVLKGKGSLLNAINAIFFKVLSSNSIPNHYIEKLSDNSFKAKKVDIIPLEIVVRNYTAGSLCKRYGIESGRKIDPIVEFFVKNDVLNDPLICKNVITQLGIATKKTLDTVEKLALAVNDALLRFSKAHGLILADFKIEVGTSNDELLISDEITPDTCRFWDIETHESLDKDVYRQSIGNPLNAYEEVLRRLSR